MTSPSTSWAGRPGCCTPRLPRRRRHHHPHHATGLRLAGRLPARPGAAAGRHRHWRDHHPLTSRPGAALPDVCASPGNVSYDCRSRPCGAHRRGPVSKQRRIECRLCQARQSDPGDRAQFQRPPLAETDHRSTSGPATWSSTNWVRSKAWEGHSAVWETGIFHVTADFSSTSASSAYFLPQL